MTRRVDPLGASRWVTAVLGTATAQAGAGSIVRRPERGGEVPPADRACRLREKPFLPTVLFRPRDPFSGGADPTWSLDLATSSRASRLYGALAAAGPIGLVGGVVTFWSVASVLAGTTGYLALRDVPGGPSWLRVSAPSLLAGALWIPLTLGIVAITRRLPPVTPGDAPGDAPGEALGVRWWRVALHVSGSLGVTYVLNGVYHALASPDLRNLPGAFGATVNRAALANLHLNAGTYWVIVFATVAVRRLAASASGAAEAAPPEPESAPATPESATAPTSAPRPSGAAPPSADLPARFASTLTVRSGKRRVLVPVSELRWIEGSGDYVTLHVGKQRHLMSERLKSLEERLDPERFVRVHRSAIVNVAEIRMLEHVGHGDHEATLVDGTTIRVSRTWRARLQEVLERREARVASAGGADHIDTPG